MPVLKLNRADTDFLIGPGAMGTQLQAAGLPLGEGPERWNLECPERVVEVHRAYAAVGAGWSLTNTFGANRVRLALAELEGRVAEINRAALQCAREGAPGLPALASLGPTGAHSPETWQQAYEEQVAALAEAGVDGFLVETIVQLREGVTAVRAAARAGTGTVWASYTPGPDGRMLDGTPAAEAAAALAEAGAKVVGVNCGNGPGGVLEAARRLRAGYTGPLLAAPSAGLPTMAGGRAVYGLSPEEFVRAAVEFREIGVRFFAGCCGTSPAHIRAAASME